MWSGVPRMFGGPKREVWSGGPRSVGVWSGGPKRGVGSGGPRSVGVWSCGPKREVWSGGPRIVGDVVKEFQKCWGVVSRAIYSSGEKVHDPCIHYVTHGNEVGDVW